MKHLLIVLSMGICCFANATVWNIEVGGESGSATNPPYYSPQNLTILEGDQVVWNWVGGPFNVTCTGGAVFFASGNLLPGQTYSFTFTVSGIYTFECTLEDHNETMFGSIFVFPTGASNVNETMPEVSISPNPAANVIRFESEYNIVSLHIMDEMGRLVERKELYGAKSMDVSHLASGNYILMLFTSYGVARKRLIIQ